MSRHLTPGETYRIEYSSGLQKPFYLGSSFNDDRGSYSEGGVRLKLYGLGISQLDVDSLLWRVMTSGGGVDFIPSLKVSIALSDSLGDS